MLNRTTAPSTLALSVLLVASLGTGAAPGAPRATSPAAGVVAASAAAAATQATPSQAGPPAEAASAQPASVKAAAADASWLAGCWELTRGARHIVEHWMPAEGGTLIGMSRTVANGKTMEFELLMIRERDGGIEYVARPSGQAEAIFPASRVSAGELVFENATHDFPQRIIYRKTVDGGLAARIEGTMNGQARGIDFPYRAAPCGR